MVTEVKDEISQHGEEWAKEEAPVTLYSLMPEHYGLPSQILPHMRVEKLALRQADGTPVWTDVDPGVRPEAGNVLCLLHPDHPDRAKYTAMGLGVCHNSHIWNEEYELELHMKAKHRKEWATIERAREKEREARRDEQQERMIEALARSNQPSPPVEEERELYVSDKDKK